MKRNKRNLVILIALMAVSFAGLSPSGLAQNANANQKPINTTSKMIYHNGPVLTGASDVYVIWYGCWRSDCGNWGSANTQFVLIDFLSSLGSTPYFQINSTYPNSSGQAPSGGLLYGGSAVQLTYTHGYELTEPDISAIVADQVLNGELPLDPSGLYLVITSADISANSVGFCSAGAPPFHGVGTVLGTQFRYGFIGHAARCPSIAASQFMAADGTLLPTPNSDLPGDAMASDIAHVLSTMVTDPFGGAWYDRYGLENADKCQGTFGQTYTTSNGARANLRFGQRDFLIQQNWVNDRRGRCALSQ